jgi:hypothetical protein
MDKNTLQLQMTVFQNEDKSFKQSERMHLLTSFLSQSYLSIQDQWQFWSGFRLQDMDINVISLSRLFLDHSNILLLHTEIH